MLQHARQTAIWQDIQMKFVTGHGVARCSDAQGVGGGLFKESEPSSQANWQSLRPKGC